MKALTHIRHGKPDGTVIELQPGDTVKKSDFSEDELKALQAAGAIADKAPEEPEEAPTGAQPTAAEQRGAQKSKEG